MAETIKFNLNGQEKTFEMTRERTLLWVLRTDYQLTGTKYGCGMGYCGACTVLVNKRPVRSCMVTADYVDGKDVVTIEGLKQNGELILFRRLL
jgi:aerobic-type carbon monoxide dehydrogenase small subunit (CoxS/CutS family)